MSEIWGTRLVYGVGISIASFLSLFIPTAAKIHYGLLIFVRLLTGLCLVSRNFTLFIAAMKFLDLGLTYQKS